MFYDLVFILDVSNIKGAHTAMLIS
jgi:hypothetical protein